ncbi:hypothetical protein [Hyalangium versicolor]|uniref:hypothetical protein n=1 Tax=Hyalangium versicolor TaxID=2861190 RepID=UPI001CD0320D|nr:hypothetical protein [Hyalangium versicolor]
MIKPKHEKLKWTLEVLTGTEVNTLPLIPLARVSDQACFAVRGPLTTAMPIVYVVSRDDATRTVRVLLMAQVSDLTPETEGEEVRLPQGRAFLVSQAPSSIHVLAVESVLSRDELARCFMLILGEPPPATTTSDSTVTSGSTSE